MAKRIAATLDTHAWVVLEEDGRVRGYAYDGPFRARLAYRWSCEVSVYVEPGRRRTGAGRQLYASLFERLGHRGYRTAGAGMTLPNEASVALHRAMGFQRVGTYRDIGYKFGAWHDVFWTQRPLAAVADPPTAGLNTPLQGTAPGSGRLAEPITAAPRPKRRRPRRSSTAAQWLDDRDLRAPDRGAMLPFGRRTNPQEETAMAEKVLINPATGLRMASA